MMKAANKYNSVAIMAALLLLLLTANIVQAETVNWQGPSGLTITSVKYLKTQSHPVESPYSLSTHTITQQSSSFDFPVPPLAGFSPLIAITTSDERGSGGNSGWEQTLETSYAGNDLNPPAESNYIIGIYDSGADVDLFAGISAETLGFTGDNLTGSAFPIGGVGGTVDAVVSQPVGIFAAGLSAINPDGTIDLSQLLGHSNVAALITPPIVCGNGESVSGVIGNPFIAFHTAVIRNDDMRTTQYNGQMLSSPDVQILQAGSTQIPAYPKKIALNFSGLANTANYYNLTDPLSDTPEFPTMLSFFDGFLPLGGSFLATIFVVSGEPGPTNPLQEMTVLVDTGAQSSIISPAMIANLGLPIEPHFTVDVCGVGGLVPDISGYYIDYVKINAAGGALEYSQVPFVVLDLALSDGTTLDGVLGMNFFWNRNIIFEPNPSGSGFLHVSDPVPYGNADFNFDGDLNLIDFSIFASSWMSQSPETEYIPVCDMYLDSKVDINDFQAFLEHWLQ